MSWAAAGKATKKFSSGGRYFKLDDGQRASLLFLGPPLVRFVEWVDGKSTIKHGPGEGGGPRYLAVVYNIDAPSGAQQIEMSPTLFRQVTEEIGTAPDPSQVVVKMKRTGTGTDTTYSVMEAGKPTPEQHAEALAADAGKMWSLLDLEGVLTLEEAMGSKLDPSPPASSAAVDEDIPFSQPRA